VIELVSFIDAARVFGEGSRAAAGERHLAAAGVGVRLPPVVGSAVEVGWSRPLNGPSRGGRFYVTVQRVAPY
jgi:hemolysin activation/secretion protein